MQSANNPSPSRGLHSAQRMSVSQCSGFLSYLTSRVYTTETDNSYVERVIPQLILLCAAHGSLVAAPLCRSSHRIAQCNVVASHIASHRKEHRISQSPSHLDRIASHRWRISCLISGISYIASHLLFLSHRTAEHSFSRTPPECITAASHGQQPQPDGSREGQSVASIPAGR